MWTIAAVIWSIILVAIIGDDLSMLQIVAVGAYGALWSIAGVMSERR